MPNFEEYYQKNLFETKKKIKDSVKDDTLIIQAISSVDELSKIQSMLIKRLREWYELYNPEFSKSMPEHDVFAENILQKSRKELLQGIGLSEEESMGANLSEDDIKKILELAEFLKSAFTFRKKQELYVEKLMEQTCPNIAAVSGPLIGAKLIAAAGSLKRLSELPASTLQLLGAERALFRHLRNKSNRPPRHGLIVQHPLLAAAPQKEHGKRARALADKISIAAKVDYFKGNFIGDKLKRMLEEKFR